MTWAEVVVVVLTSGAVVSAMVIVVVDWRRRRRQAQALEHAEHERLRSVAAARYAKYAQRREHGRMQ